jgi:hypothetical protein
VIVKRDVATVPEGLGAVGLRSNAAIESGLKVSYVKSIEVVVQRV